MWRETNDSSSATPGSHRERSNIILPVYIREDVIAPLAIGQKFFVDHATLLLVVEPGKTQNVIPCSFRCIVPGCPCFHQESPIARLGQQQFTCHLTEHFVFPFGRCLLGGACCLSHASGGCVKVRIDPGIRLIQPNLPEPLVPPARGTRSDNLKRIVAFQVGTWSGELKDFLVVNRFANKQIQKPWSLVPPM